MPATSTYERYRDHPYVLWNNAVAQVFFREERAGQQVWLSATPRLLERVGAQLGSTARGLVSVLLEGPPWAPKRDHLCANAAAAADGWRARRFPYPPFIHYLSLFTAAGTQGDVAVPANAYYPRLWAMIGDPERRGTPPGFGQMAALWADLERWSTDDEKGRLGVFTASMVGQRRHIGLPLAQNLLLPAERAALPAVFAGMAPGSAGGDALAQLVASSTAPTLSRVRQVLRTAPKPDQVLLRELLVDAWQRWSSTAATNRPTAPRSHQDTSRPAATAPLWDAGEVRLAVSLDRAARAAHATLRCYSTGLPEVPLRLRDVEGATWECEEETDGWSTELSGPDGDIDAAALGDWASTQTLTAPELGCRFVRPGTRAAVLKPGSAWGLPGLLETHELESGQQAYVLAHADSLARIESWAADPADGLTPIPCEGLPARWQLAHIGKAPNPEPLRGILPWLPQPQAPRLALSGGLRARPGNHHQYLAWAPPAVRLTTGPEATFWVGDRQVAANRDGELQIPGECRRPGPLQIRATSNGATIASTSIELVADVASQPAPATPVRFGRPGKAFRGTRDPMQIPEIAALFKMHQGRRLTNDVLLLDRSGHLCEWSPEVPLPESFSAVWAVIPGPPAHVTYCGGGSPRTEGPTGTQPGDAWKTQVRRAAPEPPRPLGPGPVAELWAEYLKAAT